MHLVELLTVVLVRLFILLTVRILSKSSPEGIVMVLLDGCTVCIGYHPVITQMVGQVEVIGVIFDIATVN